MHVNASTLIETPLNAEMETVGRFSNYDSDADYRLFGDFLRMVWVRTVGL